MGGKNELNYFTKDEKSQKKKILDEKTWESI